MKRRRKIDRNLMRKNPNPRSGDPERGVLQQGACRKERV